MIVGPNGAGKSTIINAVSQAVPYEGQVLFEGKDFAKLRSVQRAKSLGVLAQNHYVGYSFSVGEVVRLGRYAYAKGPLSPRDAEDEARVADALNKTGMEKLVSQSVLTLSGGELQRAFLAQLFAQNPRLLMLDEPANHLSLTLVEEIEEALEAYAGAVVVVSHDRRFRERFSGRRLELTGGRVTASSG